MYKVLLIDDEKNIVNGISRFIDWNEYHCEICGYAYNGIEGITAAQELLPDIIITDIKMPYMDGLEMIRQIKSKNANIKFIILSGYSEFEYAKKGIEMGISSYLLKPIDEDVLKEQVRMLIDEIEREIKKDSEFIALKASSHHHAIQLKEHLLRDIVDSGIKNDTEIRFQLDSLNIPYFDTNYACIVVETEALAVDSDAVINRIYAVLNPVSAICFKYGRDRIAVIINDKHPVTSRLLKEKSEQIIRRLMTEMHTNVSIGIGDVYPSLSKISTAFEEARYALSHKIIRGSNKIISIDDTRNETTSIAIPESIFTDIRAAIDANDFEKACCIINTFFTVLLSENSISPIELQLQALNLILNSLKKLDSLQIYISKYLGKDIVTLDNISRFKTVTELKNWTTNVIKTIIEVRKEQKKYADNDIINDAKAYIDSHYQDNITLNALAERFFINPFYLSQLFKKKTGNTYMSYITFTRMTKAKELFDTTNLKIYEVSEKVGYLDTKYFSRIFERHTGIKPSEYKKNI